MRPAIRPETAVRLAEDYWGLQPPINCTELDAYDDRNYRLTIEGVCKKSFVLKVHNTADSLPEELYAEAQNALLGVLAEAQLPVPQAVPLARPSSSSSDGFTIRTAADDGSRHAVRLLTWVSGDVLVGVAQSAALYRSLGCLLARVDQVLLGCDLAQRFPALRRRFDWNMERLPDTYTRIRGDLLSLPGVDTDMLDAAVEQFAAATRAAGNQLRRCIIHSDANERNVLVHTAAAAAAAQRQQRGENEEGRDGGAAVQPLLAGLIDWGDACEQWLACEPAAACVYVGLLDANAADPLPAMAALLEGYEARLPLLPGERLALRALAAGRLALSLSMGAHSAARQPDNAAYLLGTQANGWRLLRLLARLSDDAFLVALGACSSAGPAAARPTRLPC